MEKYLTGYASIDKPWQKYYPNANMTQEEIDRRINKSIFQMLDESTKDFEDDITIEYHGSTITNKEFKKRILECAKSFAVLGVKQGDVVPLILPNQPESRISIYALNILGAIPYPIQPSLASKQLEKIIYENNAKNLVIFRGFYSQYKKSISMIKNIIYTTGLESLPKKIQTLDYITRKYPEIVIPYQEFILEHESFTGTITPKYEKNSIAAIIGTSGTTGISKGVCLSNEGLNAMALQHMEGHMNLERGEIILNILIDSIGYGIGTMHYSECCGLKSILIPELVTNVAPLFLKYHPNHFTGGPIHAEELEKYLRDPKNKSTIEELQEILYRDVKNWVSGGAPLKKSTEENLNKPQILVRQGLGCTENSGAATYAKKGAYKEGGVGIPLMLETMGIFEPGTDRELKYCEQGEICITGPTVMLEYLNNSEETEKVIKVHSDGKRWIHTGDKGYIDEDGQVFVIGRYKDMIHRMGFNIFPNVIANELSNSKIDGILEYAVIAIPHHYEQNVPVAFVSINGSADANKLKDELLKYAQKNLDVHDIPYDIVFIKGPLPKNLGGKIDNKKILEIANLEYTKENDKPRYQVLETGKVKVKKR